MSRVNFNWHAIDQLKGLIPCVNKSHEATMLCFLYRSVAFRSKIPSNSENRLPCDDTNIQIRQPTIGD